MKQRFNISGGYLIDNLGIKKAGNTFLNEPSFSHYPMTKRENNILQGGYGEDFSPGVKSPNRNENPLPKPEATDGDEFIRFLNHCLVDPSGKQFFCLHEYCSDLYSCFRQEILLEYISFHSLLYHPIDRETWCRQIYPDILHFSAGIPENQLDQFRVTFNHRYISKTGAVSQFKHEGTLYSDEHKKLALNLKIFNEIGDLKTDDSMVLTISRYSVKTGYEKVFSRTYSDFESSPLSQREIEIVQLCREGLSSKMIADKLGLSIHTVKNHKRNIMEKTHTHNITELIHVCSRNRWL
jgi:DNA-binding CsgD family transcriptional regulator